jgi:hypothetical protein
VRHFVAFAARDRFHAETTTRAAKIASCADLEYVVWSREDQSGSTVHRAVDGWIDDAQGFVADITFVNDNVTYELGYAIGAGKNIRIIRNAGIDLSDVNQIGLFGTMLRDKFRKRAELESMLCGRQAPRNNWLASAGGHMSAEIPYPLTGKAS